MHKTIHLTWQLKAGVSTAAMMAAAFAFMPGDARAQSCTTTNNLQGLADGTVVTCPSSNQLGFPGGVDQGAFGVPDGSILTFVNNGNNPTHQQWNYIDPAGNNTFVFLSGDYNLINGLGGTTVLEGKALLGLGGAGSCGVGGLVCPGGVENLFPGFGNVTSGSGSGSVSDVAYPTGGSYPTTEPGAPGGLADNVFDPLLCDQGGGCGSSPFNYGVNVIDSSLTAPTFFHSGEGDITIDGVGLAESSSLSPTIAFVPLSEAPFTDSTSLVGDSAISGNTASSLNDLLGGPEFGSSLGGGRFMNVDPQINENFEACQDNFGSCSLIVNEGGGALVIHYPPTIRGGESGRETSTDATSLAPTSDSITVIGNGFEGYGEEPIAFETESLLISVPQTIVSTEGGGLMMLGGSTTTLNNDPGALVDAGELFEAHDRADLLLQNQMNLGGGGNAGASSSFSYPSTDGSFLFTANDSPFGVITPIPPPGSTTFETENGGRIHVDGSVSGLPGAEGVDTTVSTENRGDGGTSFVLIFSEPMDKDTIEDNFTIRSFDSTVIALDGTTISGNTATPDSSNIWDQGGYDVDWNSDDTEVTFTFREREIIDEGWRLLGSSVFVTFEEDAEPDNDLVGWRADFNTPVIIESPDDTTPADPDLAESAQSNPEPEYDSSFSTALFIIEIINRIEEDGGVAASRATDVNTVGAPNFESDDGLESGNTASWSP